MSANEIPPDDWHLITAGVSDPDVLVCLRIAYTLGGYRMKRLILEATGPIAMPDIAPIAVLVPHVGLDWLCERCGCLAAFDDECPLCRAAKPPEADDEEVG